MWLFLWSSTQEAIVRTLASGWNGPSEISRLLRSVFDCELCKNAMHNFYENRRTVIAQLPVGMCLGLKKSLKQPETIEACQKIIISHVRLIGQLVQSENARLIPRPIPPCHASTERI